VATPEHERTLRAVRASVDTTVATAEAADGRSPAFPVDATRVARGPGGCLYRVDPPPEVALVEDAPVRLTAGGRHVRGRLGPVADESCLVETEVDLGPRLLDGRLVVDNAGPVRALADRLAALSGAAPYPPGFRFDQAALVLGAPGGRLRDRIAEAAGAADGWSLDDRAGDALHAALRQRRAWVQSPPGGDAAASVALVARLLDRLLQLDATVLFAAPSGHGVDRTVGAVCERLAGAGQLRSGLVQRVGPLAPGAVRDRYGPYLEAATIAADLRAGLDERLDALDRVDSRLRFEEAEWRVAELDRDTAAVDDRLGQAVGGRLARRPYEDPDTLVLRRHALREQRRSARQAADRIALELAGGGRVPSVEEVLGEGGGRSPGERRRKLAEARDELLEARDGIEEALRRRCRLAAATTRSAYTRDLPRTDYDVVVMAGPATIPESYYLAGLSTRSVVSVGDAGGDGPEPAGTPGRAAPHAEGTLRRGRPPTDKPGGAHPVRPRWRPGARS